MSHVRDPRLALGLADGEEASLDYIERNRHLLGLADGEQISGWMLRALRPVSDVDTSGLHLPDGGPAFPGDDRPCVADAPPMEPQSPGTATSNGQAPHRVTWTTGRDLMAAEFPEPRWAVPGLVAEGLTMLCGPPKVGKSWLALDLALSVAAGGSAIGAVPVEQGKVALLALEDTGRRLQRRFGMLLDGEEMPDGLGVTTEVPALDDGLLDELDGLDTANLRLVVLDVLQRVRPRSGSESVYERDYQVVSALKAWSDRHGVSVVVCHHTRKQGSDDFVDTVSGSHGLAGAADAVLVMARARNSADATLSVTGRDIEEAEYALKFDATRGAWHLLDGPASDYQLGDTRRAVLDYLRTHGPARPKTLADALDLEHDTAKQTCYRMAEAGQVDTDGQGLYLAPTDPLSPPSPLSPEQAGDGDTSDRGDGANGDEDAELWPGEPL